MDTFVEVFNRCSMNGGVALKRSVIILFDLAKRKLLNHSFHLFNTRFLPHNSFLSQPLLFSDHIHSHFLFFNFEWYIRGELFAVDAISTFPQIFCPLHRTWVPPGNLLSISLSESGDFATDGDISSEGGEDARSYQPHSPFLHHHALGALYLILFVLIRWFAGHSSSGSPNYSNADGAITNWDRFTLRNVTTVGEGDSDPNPFGEEESEILDDVVSLPFGKLMTNKRDEFEMSEIFYSPVAERAALLDDDEEIP